MVAHGQHHRAFRLAALAAALVIAVTAVCYGPFVFFLDFLVNTYLPSYVDATNVIKLAVIAGALRFADFFASFAILCDQEQPLTWAFGVLILIVAGSVFLAHSFGSIEFDPDRLVIVTVGVSLCTFLISFVVAFRASRRRDVRVRA
jgi:hypothetical protein